MLLAIVFGAVFLSVVGGLSGFALAEHRSQTVTHLRTQAVALAEAGLEQYRWRAARGLAAHSEAETFTMAHTSLAGGSVGDVSVSVTPIGACGEVIAHSVRSVGVTASQGVAASITARYAQPSVAEYAFVTNGNVFIESDRVVPGPIHANGGVRMDVVARAPVTSSAASWNCAFGGGCATDETVEGVFGTEEENSFWRYPVPQIDFMAIAAHIPVLKNIAERDGVYLPRISSGEKGMDAYWRGYRLVFNEDRTVTVYRVTATEPVVPLAWANPSDAYDGAQDRTRIASSVMHGTYSLSEGCGLIYAEDHVWVEGVVSGKVTLVAANADPAVSPNVYVRGPVSYRTGSDVDGLTVIAEHNVLIAADAPAELSVSGVLVAQDGSVGRNAYACSTDGSVRETLTLIGSVVSNKRMITHWPSVVCDGGVGGYQVRTDIHDRTLADVPPPFTPRASEDFVFMGWREE